MQLLLTSVLPFLAHDHASAVAFLTCRHHNFHASIIPEFLSDEERVKAFCQARQQNQIRADSEKQYANLYNLFVQTPLMQFSPSMIVSQKDCADSILKPLLATKYFTRTLQHCSVMSYASITNELLQALSKVQSLTNLDLEILLENEHLEIIINSFPSLEILIIRDATRLETVDPNTAIRISSPPPAITNTLRSLKLDHVDALFAAQLVPHFSNLRKLELRARNLEQGFDLLPLSSSLPLLRDVTLEKFTLKHTESFKNLAHLSSLELHACCTPDPLKFLKQENSSLPELRTLRIIGDHGYLTDSFASLSHAPNLQVFQVVSGKFNDDCLQYLQNMVHLRKLELSSQNLAGARHGAFHLLMHNLFQLEELHLWRCRVGNHGVIVGALYSTDSRLRVLNLRECSLDNDDLNGIGALKNTLEVLHLGVNIKLTNQSLVHCKDLVKLRVLKLAGSRIDDLSPLNDCLNLEELDVSWCSGLTDDSFKVFSEEPSSFQKLCVLNIMYCRTLTEKVFEHLSKNNHLVYRLKELSISRPLTETLSASTTARNNICQLKGLRIFVGASSGRVGEISKEEIELKTELIRRLKNLDVIA